jgi:hypothetical protein
LHALIECIQLQEILVSLGDLHFPHEWRLLFNAAGITNHLLENVESTRTLISIVTDTVDRRPFGVPTLDLIDLEDEVLPRCSTAFSELSVSDDEDDVVPAVLLHPVEAASIPPAPPVPPDSSLPHLTQWSSAPLLEDLKTSIQNMKLRPTQQETKVKRGFDLDPKQLQEQRSHLRSSILPHPSQLKDLAKVPQDDLTNLAQVLKKVCFHKYMIYL